MVGADDKLVNSIGASVPEEASNLTGCESTIIVRPAPEPYPS